MVTPEQIDRPPRELRQAYLGGLREPQELYLEERVQAGTTWRVGARTYAVTHNHAVVEFFSEDHNPESRAALLSHLVHHSQADTILCKSFDHLLLRAALASPAVVRATGLLYRQITNSDFDSRQDIEMRPGAARDIASIAAFNDNFFADRAEIAGYIERGDLAVAEHNGDCAGCGIRTLVVVGQNVIDIGMLVAKPYRGRGIGAHIIAYLKDLSLRRGERPICGCSIDNPHSAHALVNAGFACEHLLLEITPAD
ncbi:MAG: GNAT family N-acetyltransferase [Pseudomonadota bacterium]